MADGDATLGSKQYLAAAALDRMSLSKLTAAHSTEHPILAASRRAGNGSNTSRLTRPPIKDVDGIVVGSVDIPDTSARQAAADRAQERSRCRDAAGEAVTVNELKRNTVEHGHHVSGVLMFKAEKHPGRSLLRVPVEDVVFEFPRDIAKP